MTITHEHLLVIVPRLPTDYSDYGGDVVRWENEPETDDGDCSWGCRWVAKLAPPHKDDWVVCTKPGAPRCGMLTFEHQAGRGCFEGKP